MRRNDVDQRAGEDRNKCRRIGQVVQALLPERRRPVAAQRALEFISLNTVTVGLHVA